MFPRVAFKGYDLIFTPCNSLQVSCGVRGDIGPACNAVGYLDRTILGLSHLYQRPVFRRTPVHYDIFYSFTFEVFHCSHLSSCSNSIQQVYCSFRHFHSPRSFLEIYSVCCYSKLGLVFKTHGISCLP